MAHRGVVPLYPRTRGPTHGTRFPQFEMLVITAHMIRCRCRHGEALTCNLGSLMSRVPCPL